MNVHICAFQELGNFLLISLGAQTMPCLPVSWKRLLPVTSLVSLVQGMHASLPPSHIIIHCWFSITMQST